MSANEMLVLTRDDAGVVVATLELMRGVDETEILNVETLPSHRRQGLARSLLVDAFDWARQNNRQAVWLEVRVGNAAAITLYEKAGFIPVRLRKRYYADGEDALVMKYTLEKNAL